MNKDRSSEWDLDRANLGDQQMAVLSPHISATPKARVRTLYSLDRQEMPVKGDFQIHSA